MLPLLPNSEMPNLDAKMSLGNVKSCTRVATYLPLEPSSEAIIELDRESDCHGSVGRRAERHHRLCRLGRGSKTKDIGKLAS